MSDTQPPAGRHVGLPQLDDVWTVLDQGAGSADEADSGDEAHSGARPAADPAGPRRTRVGAALLDRLPVGGQQVAIGLGRHWWLPVVIVVAALALAVGAVVRARPVLAGGPGAVGSGTPAVSVAAARPSTALSSTALSDPGKVLVPVSSTPVSKQASAVPTAGVTSPAWVVVDVAGRVRHPGVIRLPPGSRVVDALAAAGGALRGVDLAPLNLAQPLSDGEQIRIGIDEPGLRSATPPAGGSASPGAGGATGAATAVPGAVVDINTADAEQLDTLPGIGPVLAARIVDWRTAHGPFAGVEDVEQVPGIGPATLEKFRSQITTGP